MAKKQEQKQKTLVALGQHDCRWPIGDPKLPGFHFCGARAQPGRPYCELHTRMAIEPSRSRESRPAVIGVRRAA
jgi:GcrA cell cycle regulator